MNKKLKKSLNQFYQKKENVQETLYGELGIPISGKKTVDVPGRMGYVYVRLRGNESELVQAYNSTVPSKYDYPVIVSRKGNKYAILGRDNQRFSNMGNAGNSATTVNHIPLPNHGGQHSFNPSLGMGADPTWVYGQQFMPNLAHPSGTSLQLSINPHFYEWNGEWKYPSTTGTIDLAPYVPTVTGSARFALLYVNGESTDIEIAGGVGFSGGINNAAHLAQYIPDVDRNTSIPLAAVKLTTGTTSIDWTDIYDVRDYYTVQKYFDGIGLQDGGVPAGTGTILNFGDNLSVSVTDGIATIDASGGGGGSSVWTTGSAGAYSITTIDGVNESLADRAVSHGNSNVASGTYSHAEGNGVQALGTGSHAEGLSTTAQGDYSHAEGWNNIVSGSWGHGMGAGNHNYATGGQVAGLDNRQHGEYSSIIAGQQNRLLGDYSSILAGTNITGSSDNTAYTDLINIKTLNTGTSIANVGIDAEGFLVTGTAGGGGGGGTVPPELTESRLSISSTLAITTADIVSASTLYLHPYKGNRISLYSGSEWEEHTLSSAISLTLTSLATASTCYDIFVYDNSGLTLEAVAWTSSTVRATALATQDGVYVKSGATGRKYVGTVYIDGSKQATMEWDKVNNTSILSRHVWNYYNRVLNHARHVSTSAHTYASGTYRKWRNNNSLTHQIVQGVLEDDIFCFAGGNQRNNANLDVAVNWVSGGGELVDWYNASSAQISAFTGGGLRRNRISTPGLVTVVVLQNSLSGTANFSSGVLDVGCFS